MSKDAGIVEEQKISVKDRIAMFSKGSSSNAPPLQKRHTVTTSQLKSFQPKPAPAPAARGSVVVKPQEGQCSLILEKKEEAKPSPPKFTPQRSEPAKVESSGGFLTHAKTEGPQVFGGVAFGSIKDNPFLKNQKKQQAPAPPPKKPLPSFVTQQKKDAPASVPKTPVEAPKPAVVAAPAKPQPPIAPKPAPAPVQTSSTPSTAASASIGVERQTSAKGIEVEAISAARKKALAMFGGQKKVEAPAKPKWKTPKTAADYKPKEPTIFQKQPEPREEPKIEKKVEFAPEVEDIPAPPAPPPPPPPAPPVQEEVVKPVDPLFAPSVPEPPQEIEKPKPQRQIGKIQSPFFNMEKNQEKKKEEELAEKQRKRMEEISALRKEKEVQIFQNSVGDEEEEEQEDKPRFRQSTSVKRDNTDFNDFKAKLAAQFGQRAGFANREESESEEEKSEEEEDEDDDDEPAPPANPMMMISAQVESSDPPPAQQAPQGGIFDQMEQVDEQVKDQHLSNDVRTVLSGQMLFNKPAARKSKKAAVIFDEEDDQDFA